jgi:DNA-binding transcriptional ArsR family regulator
MNNDNNKLDSVFSALANKHRRSIVYQLSLQPTSISQLADELRLSLPAIHKHIVVLEEGGYVQRKKSGRTYFLALNRVGLLQAQDWVNQYQAFWGSNHETLENYVASIEKKKLSTKEQKVIYEKVRIPL